MTLEKRQAEQEESSKKAKTVESLIIDCIREQKQPNGSSQKAILKHTKLDPDELKQALKQMAESKVLTKVKMSYIVTDDPKYEDLTPKVQIESFMANATGKKMVKIGSQVSIHYIGTLKDKTEFDRGDLDFLVGGGEVIKGFDQSVLGMVVGERRVCQIPSQLGYGKRGSPPEIPPNSDLIFDITLKSLS
ncbi:hypothetical protein EDD86DRAFT_244431 [Gorgonomyces haynaldii]|nr:hypothetical protein EDD86DRAFT_244431 [Gorgonomyces haynaldii]